jgi:16S rRNA (uracil1498-N3)-methyltransferase
VADRFYINSDLAPGPAELYGDEAHHLAAVCRVRPGDAVCLFNGDGHDYPARVEAVQKRVVTLHVTGVVKADRELPFRLEVAAALPRGDRAQVMVEKLTELGVTAFVPLQTGRGVVQPRENKLDRLQRHVIEASKQCGRNVLLSVEPPAEWAEYCRRPGLPARRLLAHPGGGALSTSGGSTDVAVAVGPEGGFTDEEVGQALDAGWALAGLGPRILRVETAAVTLAAWFSVAASQIRHGE